ncbi:MAG TPA: BON domain-containing protein [Gemmatimonadaceae bacterium]|nr:BON domain-containing protein [Gemmatimonadaceae bacterium]
MSPLRYRDDDSQTSGLLFLAAGAVLGLAAGLVVADRFGGFSALTSRIRERVGRAREDEGDEDDVEYEEDDEALEERVLEAFRNDPVLAERAVDIGAIGDGIIELTGWVHEPDEATHAVTITRGVPGVETVVNRLDVRLAGSEEGMDNEEEEDTNAPIPGGRWEGQQVGTGRRRQGNSSEPDRHADPKPELEDRWLSKEQALREAAGEIEGGAERRRSSKKPVRGDRTGGSPIAPTGVPKADHVADPESAPDSMRAD